jgi:GMP synthase PP-ATPase subunit
MATLNSNILLRLPVSLRDSYAAVCKSRGVSVSDDLRAYIHTVVLNAVSIPAPKTPQSSEHFELLPERPVNQSAADKAVAARLLRKKKSKR